MYITISKFGITKDFFFKDIDPFIQQGCIQYIKNDSKDFLNATNSEKCCSC